MVAKGYIDLGSLTLEELAGVVNIYPWFAGARKELCLRMSRIGSDNWGISQFADAALYIPERGIISSMVRSGEDCSDSEALEILKTFIAAPEQTPEAEETTKVHVVGGDYFSQSEYDNVKTGGEGIFSRLAASSKDDASTKEDAPDDIANRFPTETLAEIFAEQGCVDEARRIYSRLSLENPEKSAYFASLIEKLN